MKEQTEQTTVSETLLKLSRLVTNKLKTTQLVILFKVQTLMLKKAEQLFYRLLLQNQCSSSGKNIQARQWSTKLFKSHLTGLGFLLPIISMTLTQENFFLKVTGDTGDVASFLANVS